MNPTPAESATSSTFDEFVMARGRALWRAAWHLTHDRHLAEDLVQTALLKSFSRYEQVAPDGSFEAYVRRVMFTTYLSTFARQDRWTELRSEGPGASSRELEVASTLDLVAAMSQLPPGQRAVLVLRYLLDLSVADAAATLGCSDGNVKSQASRALAALRDSGLLDMEE